MKWMIVLLCFFLLIKSPAMAIELNSLSNEELNVLKKINIPEEEIKSLDVKELKSLLKDKFDLVKNDLKAMAKEKLEEMANEALEREKKDLKKQAIKVGAGYALSTLSLFAATLIAPQALMVCKTKPSAVIYAGSAAVYIFQEMLNVKGLKAAQLAEIEVVDRPRIDKSKTIGQNAEMFKNKIDQQVGYLIAYKNALDHTIKALKKKAKNAKMVSIGFLASSAAAAAEQMNWLGGGGACIVSSSIPKLEQLHFSKNLDQRYVHLIESAKSSADKWAYYYEWESLKFGTDRTLSWKEYNQLKNIDVNDTILTNVMNLIHSTLLSSALAQNESKKIVLIPELKEHKEAKWIVDLDKLGIAGGVATHLIAYMSGWQMGFLKSVMASGTSRAVTFGAQSALAFSAGTLFGSAANELAEKLDKIESIIYKMQKILKRGINMIIPTESEARHLHNILTKWKMAPNKLLTEMSINEAYGYLKEVRNKMGDIVDEDSVFIKKYEDKIKEEIKNSGLEEKVNQKVDEIKDKVDEVHDKTDEIKEKIKEEAPASVFIEKFLNTFVSSAMSESRFFSPPLSKINDLDCVPKKTCPHLYFPKESHPNLKALNQYLELFEKYYLALKTNNIQMENTYSALLEKNKHKIVKYRNTIFQKTPGKNYEKLEQIKVKNEMNDIQKYYDNLPSQTRHEIDKAMNLENASLANADKERTTPKITSLELQIIAGLIDRLEAREKNSSNSKLSGPDMRFSSKENTSLAEESIDFGNTSIHPKEVDIFEIIHVRYFKFLKQNFPEY